VTNLTMRHAITRRTLPLILATLWVLGWGAPVAAGTPKEEARKLFKEGNRLNAAGDHRGALNRYIKARALYPSYKIDLNIAATLYSMGRLTHAVVYYERFLERAGGQADRQAMVTARAKLRELRARLASLTVSCAERGARVTVDGKVIGITPLPRRVYLSPGAHHVVVIKGERVLLRRSLKLAAGGHRDLVITGPRRQDVPPDKLVSPFKPAPPPGKTLSPFEDEGRSGTPSGPAGAVDQRRKRKTVMAWTFLGVGLAAGATAAVLYGLGASQGAEAHEAYMVAQDPADILARWEEVEAAQAKVVTGHVLAGVAALGVGLAIYQFVTRPAASDVGHSAGQARTATLQGGLGPTPGANGATLWIRGSF